MHLLLSVAPAHSWLKLAVNPPSTNGFSPTSPLPPPPVVVVLTTVKLVPDTRQGRSLDALIFWTRSSLEE
jgi:hypothetical protein